MADTRPIPVPELVAYLAGIEKTLGTNPLLDRFGVSLDVLRIPLRVVPYQPARDLEEAQARQDLRAGRTDDSWDRWAFRGSPDEDDPCPAALRDPDNAFVGCGGSFDPRFHAMLVGTDIKELASPERPRPEHSLPTDDLHELEASLDRAVLLGDPGSGKTEWLKSLAQRTAETAHRHLEGGIDNFDTASLPLFVRLPDVARALADEDALTALARASNLIGLSRITDAQALAGSVVIALARNCGLPAVLGEWLMTCLMRDRTSRPGPTALLALDGWDEVRTGEAQLARCLEAYSRTATARILVSSRPVGYPGGLLPTGPAGASGCRELRLCPFRRQESVRFVLRYFASNPERGHRMVGELRAKPAVAGLAQSPLLVTLLCAAFSPVPDQPPLRFPVQRGELYDRVLLGLLGKWRELRERSATSRGQLPTWGAGPATQRRPRRIRAKLRLLEEMALHFFPDEFLSGDRLDGCLELWLAKRKPNDPLRELQGCGIDLLSELCEDGVLTVCGGGSSPDYMLLHLTFQETLAARGLRRRVEEEREPGLLDEVARKAWDPQWQHVVILLAGRLAAPEKLIERLADPAPDDHFRHRLAVAAEALGEIEPKRVASVMASLRDRLTRSILCEWNRHLNRGTSDLATHLQRALPILSQVGARVRHLSMERFVRRMLAVPKPLVTERAAMTLTAMGGTVSPSLDLCRDLLGAWRRSSEDLNARSVGWELGRSLDAMREAIAGRPGLVRFLLQEVRRERETSIRAHLVRFLGAIAEGTGLECEIGQTLLDALGDAESWVRNEAARALATASDEVVAPADLVPALVPLLGDREHDVRSPAAFALGRREAALLHEPTALVALGRLAQDALYWSSEEGAVYGVDARTAQESLRRIQTVAKSRPDLLNDVVGILGAAGTEFRQQCVAALATLEEAALASPKAVAALIQALEDTDAKVRESAAHALGRLGPKAATDYHVVLALLAALSDCEPRVRRMAILALGQFGEAAGRHPSVVPAALEHLCDEDAWVREAAADSLGELTSSISEGDKVAQVLVAHVQRSKSAEEGLSRDALSALSALAHMSRDESLAPHVLPVILDCLRDPLLAPQVAGCAVPKLGIAAARDLDVLSALLEACARPPFQVSSRNLGDPQFLRLSSYLHHVGLALRALSRSENPHPELVPFLAARLSGEDHELRGPAAHALLHLPEAALRQHVPVVLSSFVTVLQSMPAVAAQGLARLADAAAQDGRAVPGLVRILIHPSMEVRREAVKALWWMGSGIVHHPGVLSALVEALDHANSHVQLGAAQIVQRIGEPAARHPDVVPALLRRALPPVKLLAKTDSSSFRPHLIGLDPSGIAATEFAGKALAAVGPEAVRHPSFIKEIMDALREERRLWDVFRLLETLGLAVLDRPELLRPALSALGRVDCGRYGAETALKTLGRLELAAGNGRQIVDVLGRALRAGKDSVRRAAAVVEELGDGVGRDPWIVGGLIEALEDPDRWTRQSIAQALKQLQRQPPYLRIFRYGASYKAQEVRELSDGYLSSPAAVRPRRRYSRGKAKIHGVDVGILVALPEEFRELYAQIPSPKAELDPESGAADHLFEWPCPSRGAYCCAATFVGSMGPVEAAVATEGFCVRRRPRTLVLLGIAAGLDDAVRLGDVVVATEVVKYLDRAKVVPGEKKSFEILAGGDSYRCSADLVRAVQELEFAQALPFRAWREGARADLEKNLGPAKIKELVQKKWLREEPRLVEGLVASGPVVGAAESFVRWLKGLNRNYLALEMEGGGVLAAIYGKANPSRSLIFRGISDFGDARKQQLDGVASGGLRRQAMRNAVSLLWCALDAGVLPGR